MSKRLALIALLLPFSGVAITKQERKEAIIAEMKELSESMNHYARMMENNLWFAACFPDFFLKPMKEIDKRGYELEDELKQIEEELKQETHVS